MFSHFFSSLDFLFGSFFSIKEKERTSSSLFPNDSVRNSGHRDDTKQDLHCLKHDEQREREVVNYTIGAILSLSNLAQHQTPSPSAATDRTFV